MQIVFDIQDYTDLATLDKGIALLTHLRNATAHSPHHTSEDAENEQEVQVPSAPLLQLDVLRLLANSATGSLTSYDVAELLGMSQPEYAAKIRGTGKAGVQAQDVLYTRGWTFQDAKRVRTYTITSSGRRVAAKLQDRSKS